MQRTIKILLAGVVLAALGLPAFGFSLLGPALDNDATWQTISLGYGIPGEDISGTGPKLIGQGYRRNSGTIFYGFDQPFVEYFQPEGMAAVSNAFAIMNALPSADNMQLSQFPLDSQEPNNDAFALDLTDLKSVTLAIILEQMGLAPSVRFDWTLHDRYLPGGGAVCSTNPAVNGEYYLVTQRNYDPVSQIFSSYVNGTLYDYIIDEDCGADVFPNLGDYGIDAIADSFVPDVDALPYTPVTEYFDPWNASLQNGSYYTGLTYDDAGGLRYLYSTNNIVTENPAPGSQLEVTNSQLQLLITSDYGALLQFAQTNSPTALQAAYPNLVIDSTNTYYTIVSNPIVVSYFTNYIGATYTATPYLYIATNGYTLTAQTNYVYTFGNVVLVDYHSTTPAQEVTTSLGLPYGAQWDATPITNITTQNVILNQPSGDYYLIPPGSCGYTIYSNLVTDYLAGTTTNIITEATNTITTDGAQSGFVGSQTITTYFTNNWYEVFSCNFETSGPALYEGMGKIKFVEADYDAVTSELYSPVTDNYTMTMVNPNGQTVVQRFQRVVTTEPDILLDAEDLTAPNAPQPGVTTFVRPWTYTVDPQQAGETAQPGPGTITDYPATITYNASGPVYGVGGDAVNGTTPFLESDQNPIFTWASFDNSTNAPVIYPYGSLTNIENEILLQITPSTLPDATNGVPYSVTISASGGGFEQHFSWTTLGINPLTGQPTTVPNGLPNGLSITTTSGGDAIIYGTPSATAGTYDFILQMTDSNGRSVTWNYSINIDQ